MRRCAEAGRLADAEALPDGHVEHPPALLLPVEFSQVADVEEETLRGQVAQRGLGKEQPRGPDMRGGVRRLAGRHLRGSPEGRALQVRRLSTDVAAEGGVPVVPNARLAQAGNMRPPVDEDYVLRAQVAVQDAGRIHALKPSQQVDHQQDALSEGPCLPRRTSEHRLEALVGNWIQRERRSPKARGRKEGQDMGNVHSDGAQHGQALAYVQLSRRLGGGGLHALEGNDTSWTAEQSRVGARRHSPDLLAFGP
mmetsp:Transcript_29945/g.85433  ORF Transcript_29945/g.85433 Transcript_29945/m.85433 type:complete len:252 (+) Transcript_29945:325-1080(+)